MQNFQEAFRRGDLDFDIPEYPVRLTPQLFDLVSILCALALLLDVVFGFTGLLLCFKGRGMLTLRRGTGVSCPKKSG